VDGTETIAAIASAVGEGGIGVIRVSGPLSEKILMRLFRPRRQRTSFQSHRLYHGDIISPDEDNRVLDEVMIAFLKGPHSYTGEDSLEIYCHGGPLIMKTIIREVLRSGAKPAGPGEFTRRAFLNDRMDLSQAQAVMEMISARSEEDLKRAVCRLKGSLGEKTRLLQSALLDIAAHLEAAIDFPEDDTGLPESLHLVNELAKVKNQVDSLAATYEEGKLYREGLHVVITGKPNVGKSSILNRLVGSERAIVTSIHGTTRDLIRETVRIKGIPVDLTDTAGIRPTENIIESKGVELVRGELARADLIILVIDGSAPIGEEDREIARTILQKGPVIAVNKSDLQERIDLEDLKRLLPGCERVSVSAKTGDGMDLIEEAIFRFASSRVSSGAQEETIISDLRQRNCLEKAAGALAGAVAGIMEGQTADIVILDIRDSLAALGEITGDNTDMEIIDRIFSNFCIGK
jgi:tRNA modification GTPase